MVWFNWRSSSISRTCAQGTAATRYTGRSQLQPAVGHQIDLAHLTPRTDSCLKSLQATPATCSLLLRKAATAHPAPNHIFFLIRKGVAKTVSCHTPASSSAAPPCQAARCCLLLLHLHCCCCCCRLPRPGCAPPQGSRLHTHSTVHTTQSEMPLLSDHIMQSPAALHIQC